MIWCEGLDNCVGYMSSCSFGELLSWITWSELLGYGRLLNKLGVDTLWHSEFFYFEMGKCKRLCRQFHFVRIWLQVTKREGAMNEGNANLVSVGCRCMYFAAFAPGTCIIWSKVPTFFLAGLLVLNRLPVVAWVRRE